MPSLVVIGAQWGDEGKGKLVDYLTAQADWAVRFQGGNNAGHTVVVNGVQTKLHLIPSGILRSDTHCAIGAGVVVNVEVLKNELEGLKQAGQDVRPERLTVDRDAHLILPYHSIIDLAREEVRGENKIGTTGRGIGPAYEDRATRCGVRVAELLQLDALKERLKILVEQKNKYLAHVLDSSMEVSYEEVASYIDEAAKFLKPFIGNVSLCLSKALSDSQKVIFEGAQGTLLDQTHGTVPFVTSSSTLAGAVTIGCGVGPKSIEHILAVAKAYCTRVGEGPFPTEIHDELGDQIREKGGEFGTTTGRPRRCGWFDAVAMKRAVRLNGIDSLAITKLDVLSGVDKIKVCIKYHLDGEEIEDVPSLATDLERVEPQYIELDGWTEDISNVKKWHELPSTLRLYLNTISEILACPVSVASVGAEREETIFSSSASYLKSFV